MNDELAALRRVNEDIEVGATRLRTATGEALGLAMVFNFDPAEDPTKRGALVEIVFGNGYRAIREFDVYWMLQHAEYDAKRRRQCLQRDLNDFFSIAVRNMLNDAEF